MRVGSGSQPSVSMRVGSGPQPSVCSGSSPSENVTVISGSSPSVAVGRILWYLTPDLDVLWSTEYIPKALRSAELRLAVSGRRRRSQSPQPSLATELTEVV